MHAAFAAALSPAIEDFEEEQHEDIIPQTRQIEQIDGEVSGVQNVDSEFPDEGGSDTSVPQTPLPISENVEEEAPAIQLPTQGSPRCPLFALFPGDENSTLPTDDVHAAPASPPHLFGLDDSALAADPLPPSSPATSPESISLIPVQSPPLPSPTPLIASNALLPSPGFGSRPIPTSPIEGARSNSVPVPLPPNTSSLPRPRIRTDPQASTPQTNTTAHPTTDSPPKTTSLANETQVPMAQWQNTSAQRPFAEQTQSTIQRENDDEGDSGSEDPEDESADFAGHNIKQHYFKVPKSTSEASEKFNNIQGVLEQYLDSQFDTFFVALLLYCYGTVGAEPVSMVPFVFVGVGHEEELPPEGIELPVEAQECGIGFVLCRLSINWNLQEGADRQDPYLESRTGIALGYEDDSTTLGVLIEKEDGNFIGITSGHLTGRDPEGKSLTQPSIRQFNSTLRSLRRRSQSRQVNIDAAWNSEARDNATIAKARLDNRIGELEPYQAASDNETRKNLLAGTIVKREWKRVINDGRPCIADYLIFDLVPERKPVTHDPWEFSPPTQGVLGSIDWPTLSGWNSITFDDMVRKNGAKTKFTFGFIAGVLSSWKAPGFNSPVNEYYCLEEQDVMKQSFAVEGDSGSAVINSEGKLVGLVMARCGFEDLEVIVHPRKAIPDLEGYRKARNVDGSFDKDSKNWFQGFSDVNVTLIMCSSVLEKRANIQSLGKLYLDC